ncbi:MAG: substrate-binding domain-containing protein [Oscillospiraceae bacterium]|nr:substrate-binding domain-containing protein [Oscillospiraceae bacterium]
MNRKKLFTVVTARASASEQRSLLEGIISQAFDMNTDVAVISNIYNASEYNDFITNENSIYDRIVSQRPDGMIFTDDAFMNGDLRKSVLDKISSSGRPCVSVGARETGYDTVNSDSAEDIKRITDHLTEVHGFKEIDLLTGPEDSEDAQSRISGFRRSLEEHGIEFDSRSVIYGDFWTGSGERTALDYIEGRRKMPEALVCANDYMAYAFCDVMTAHGVKIPGDITVTGYEYTGDRMEHYPVLATWNRDRTYLGRKAAALLYEKVCGVKVPLNSQLQSRFIPGDTCTCGADHRDVAAEINEKKKQSYYASLNDTGMLEQFLTESRNIQDLIDALRRHSYFIPDVSGLFLCLYDEWCVSAGRSSGKNNSGSADTVLYSIVDIYGRVTEPVHFSRDEMFPDIIVDPDKPNAFYCCPVYFMDEDFGYMIIRYDKVGCFGESFRKWNVIAANALEFLRMKNDINYLMRCQNLSEYRDSRTGMNNREGFVNEMNIAVRNEDADSFFIIAVSLKIQQGVPVSDTNDFESENIVTDGVSEVVSGTASFFGCTCGRISDSLFAVSGVMTSDKSFPEDVLEKLNTSLYGFFRKNGIYGDGICFTKLYYGNTEGNTLDSCLSEAEQAAGFKMENKRPASSDHMKLQKLRSEIYLAPEKSITAEDACRKLCISTGYFRAVYKKNFGVSFHQDIISLKTRYAKYCLVSAGINISAVSEKCGFDDEKYFMQQFKKMTGYTPNQYRKKFMS